MVGSIRILQTELQGAGGALCPCPSECHPISGTRRRAKPPNDTSRSCPVSGSPGRGFLSCPALPSVSTQVLLSLQVLLLSRRVLCHPCSPSQGLWLLPARASPSPEPQRADPSPSLFWVAPHSEAGSPGLLLHTFPAPRPCIPPFQPVPYELIICSSGSTTAPLLISYPAHPRVSLCSPVRAPVAGQAARRA